MKKYLLALSLFCVASLAQAAPAAPTNVSVGPFRQNQSADLFWDNPSAQVTEWRIYFDGVQRYSPDRTMIGFTSSARIIYTMQDIPLEMLPVTVTVRAFSPGQGLSAASSGVYLDSVAPVPVVYVAAPAGYPLSVSMVGGSSGGSSSGSVTISGSTMSASGTPLYISPVATGLFGSANGATEATLGKVSYTSAVIAGVLTDTAETGVSFLETLANIDSSTSSTDTKLTGIANDLTAIASVYVENRVVSDSNTFAGFAPTGSKSPLSVSMGIQDSNPTVKWPIRFDDNGSLKVTGSITQTVNVTMTAVTAVSPLNVTFSSSPVTGGSGDIDATTQRVVLATNSPRQGVSITAATVGIAVSMTSAVLHPVSITTGSAFIGSVSVTAGTAVGVTLGAITGNLRTVGTGMDALNVANAFDYDVNTKTANSRRGLDITTSFYATSGTTAVTASGYTLLYDVTIYPSSVTGSNVYFFDGATTKTAISCTTAHSYAWPRGISFTNGMTIVVTGSGFDGGVTLGWTQ